MRLVIQGVKGSGENLQVAANAAVTAPASASVSDRRNKHMSMNNASTRTAVAILLIATAVVIIGGLIAVPVLMESAEAANAISELRNKGKQGESSSDVKRRGRGFDI